MAQTEENDWWDDLMMKTGRKMTGTFEDNNISFTDALIYTSGTRHMMRWIYKHMVARKRITPLEDYSADGKKEIWDFIGDICAGKTNDKSVKKEICMAFCVIEYFLKEKVQYD